MERSRLIHSSIKSKYDDTKFTPQKGRTPTKTKIQRVESPTKGKIVIPDQLNLAI